MNHKNKSNNRTKRKISSVSIMVTMYCNAKHVKSGLCVPCSKLLDYSIEKINNCKSKVPAAKCSTCKTHCYSITMREQIKSVMRYSGPRMLLYHPVMFIRHTLSL